MYPTRMPSTRAIRMPAAAGSFFFIAPSPGWRELPAILLLGVDLQGIEESAGQLPRRLVVLGGRFDAQHEEIRVEQHHALVAHGARSLEHQVHRAQLADLARRDAHRLGGLALALFEAREIL